MKKNIFLTIALLTITLLGYAQNQTYHINGNTPADGGGNDSNSGLSPTTAWASIGKANNMNLQPGDKILLFSAGAWNNGSFYFDQNDVGIPANPITISSYGPNPTANVWAGGIQGFYGENTGSVKIENINFYGERTWGGANTGTGINFYTQGGSTHRPYIFINNCRIEGFGQAGIFISSLHNNSSQLKGFSDITIKNTAVTNCGNAGVQIFAFGDDALISSNYVHRNILIENVRANRNAGNMATTTFATGNGIIVSSAEDVVIDKCVADENGALSNFATAGIAGIWYYDVKNGIIKNSEAFKNYSGLTGIDGNGFGIDGGCQNVIIEHCYSHNNEGAGYGVFEFGSPNRHENNTVRYNISQNDGRANNFGALVFWGVDALHRVNDVNVYNNTIYLNAANLANTANLPVGLKVLGNNFTNVKVANNIFHLSDASLSFTRTVSLTNQPINVLPAEVLMMNNLYYNAAGPGNFNWGANYGTLAAWRTATDQEKFNTTDYGLVANPMLTDPGAGGQVAVVVADQPNYDIGTGRSAGSPSPNNQPVSANGNIKTITQYQTTTNSPAREAGANLNTLFNVNMGNSDYYGFSLSASLLDIGAHQSNTPLPLSSLKSFTLSKQTNGNKLMWAMTEVEKISGFSLEYSTDGKLFKDLSGFISTNKNLSYSFVDFTPSATITYYRLKGVDFNWETWYSNILVARNELSKADFSIYPVPLNNSSIVFDWEITEKTSINVSDLSGRIVFSKLLVASAGKNQVELSELDNLPKGVYVINIVGASKKSFSRRVVK